MSTIISANKLVAFLRTLYLYVNIVLTVRHLLSFLQLILCCVFHLPMPCILHNDAMVEWQRNGLGSLLFPDGPSVWYKICLFEEIRLWTFLLVRTWVSQKIPIDNYTIIKVILQYTIWLYYIYIFVVIKGRWIVWLRPTTQVKVLFCGNNFYVSWIRLRSFNLH